MNRETHVAWSACNELTSNGKTVSGSLLTRTGANLSPTASWLALGLEGLQRMKTVTEILQEKGFYRPLLLIIWSITASEFERLIHHKSSTQLITFLTFQTPGSAFSQKSQIQLPFCLLKAPSGVLSQSRCLRSASQITPRRSQNPLSRFLSLTPSHPPSLPLPSIPFFSLSLLHSTLMNSDSCYKLEVKSLKGSIFNKWEHVRRELFWVAIIVLLFKKTNRSEPCKFADSFVHYSLRKFI